MNEPRTEVKVKGAFKLAINTHDPETGAIIESHEGDWVQNQITNIGFQNFLSLLVAGGAGSLVASYAALGTGTAPASNATALPGELSDHSSNCRLALSTSTPGSKTAQFTFALASNIITAARTINNVGLWGAAAASSTGGGSLFAGNTYATSSLATNQSVNGTYSISFS